MSPVTYTQHKYRPLFLDTGWLGMPSRQWSLLAIRKNDDFQTQICHRTKAEAIDMLSNDPDLCRINNGRIQFKKLVPK